MKLKQLLHDDDAVSPVIGVILMVAITVILAAVIATFVLGLGEQVSDTAPNANFQFDYESGDQNLTITHTSGPAIEASSLSTSGAANEEFTALGFSSSDEVSAGDSVEVNDTDHSLTPGEKISIIWSAEGDSATLSNYEVPN